MLAFAGTSLISTFTSLSPMASTWGLGGYYGGLMLVLFTVCLLYTSALALSLAACGSTSRSTYSAAVPNDTAAFSSQDAGD